MWILIQSETSTPIEGSDRSQTLSLMKIFNKYTAPHRSSSCLLSRQVRDENRSKQSEREREIEREIERERQREKERERVRERERQRERER